MQKPNDSLSQQPESARSKIINSYLTTIEDSFRENRSQLKLINYGTGSGKTHQLFEAICKTIKEHPDIQIIGIYVAPLRGHLDVPKEVKEEYPDIPVYKIYSEAMQTTDESLNDYKKWIPLIVKNKNFWKLISKEDTQVYQEKLNQVKKVISRLEYIKKADFLNDDLKSYETTKATRELNKLIGDFLGFVINSKLTQESWPDECLKLMERYFPLHLLREKSGILMLTYKRFEKTTPYFRHKDEKWWLRTKDTLDEYVIQHTNKKFILAFDEQEDGYQIMLEEKIDIISPEKLGINNALSSINREFPLFFSPQNTENLEFLNFVDKNKGAWHEFKEHFEKDKPIEPILERFASIYQRLIYKEGNSINFLEQAGRIKKALDKSIEEIVGICNNYDEENPIVLDFEMLLRVFAKFENNRSLVIPQKLYNQISDELMNIFSYNNLYIYNIEPLKKLFLKELSSNLVHITEEKVSGNTSVAELIYAILAVRSQIKNIKDILTNVLKAEDAQSHSLDIWSKQIEEVKKPSEEGISQNQILRYLNRIYVYESYKSIINIKEFSRYQSPKNNLIEPGLREVSIGSTAILTSPEHKINSLLSNNNNSNVIFLISATGGIFGDLSTSYDMRYLKDNLRDETGQSGFKAMVEEEVSLCEEIREEREAKRQITVNFFNENLSSFPNEQTREIAERFEQTVLKSFINSADVPWFSAYKKQELNNFIRFLFYLFEDNQIKETIAFTQTLSWIKKLIHYCQKNENFVFEASPDHPNIYYVKLNHKKYQSNIRIKLMLFEANFNTLYYDKTTSKTYLDELVEEEGQKIFFISAYRSASKGLNPTIKIRNGEEKEKDFDSLVLLMDSYYTVMKQPNKKPNDSEKSTTIYHFALMKSIVNVSDSNLEIKDFNKYLSQHEAVAFREQQHQILLGKAILQAIGRSERRDFPNQVVKIFINEETRKNLVNFYRYLSRKEPKEIRKLSVNNHKVYLKVQEEENKRAIKDYDNHVYDEIEAYFAFQSFRDKMLNDIENFHQNKKAFAITKAWEALREPIVFKEPETYLEKLRKSELFPDDFIKSLFYHKSEQPEFTPYLASEQEDGKTFQIISDSIHGDTIYSYQNRLYPESLKANSGGYDLEGNEISLLDSSTDSIYKLYNELIPDPEIFNSYIPRRDYFYDVLYPSLAENFVARWIRDIIFEGKDWKVIKTFSGFDRLLDFKKYNKLYERFDLYYIKGNTLFCIDVKAWSKTSGNRLSKDTAEKSKDKLNTIVSDYPEFSSVRGLLLNLHARQEKNNQHSSTLFSGNLIYFDNHNFPVESDTLRNFLFQKEK